MTAHVGESGRPCEWNPDENRAAVTGDKCHGDAELSVGADGKWHLCRSCAALPRFKKFRRRVPLRAASVTPHDPDMSEVTEPMDDWKAFLAKEAESE